MKAILGVLALVLMASSASAQSIRPLSGNGAVVAPTATTPTIELVVRNGSGSPAPNVTVTFAQYCTYRMRGEAPPYACVSGSGPAVTAVTDAVGRVSTPPYVADALALGNAWVTASAEVDGQVVSGVFYWTVGTTPRSPLQVVSGNNQVLLIATPAVPLVARVRDDFGQPLQGIHTSFVDACATTAGSPCLLAPVTTPQLVSDASGIVSSGVRVANDFAGAYRIGVYVEGAESTSVLYFDVVNVFPAYTATSRTRTGSEAFLRMTPPSPHCSIARMQPVPDSLVSDVPHMLAVPEGVIELNIENCPAGSKLVFSLQHPGGFPEGARVWVARPQWQALASTNTIEGFWEFSITDGGTGDADGQADGKIHALFAVAFGDPAAPNFQDLWWAGYEENGWGMSIVQHRDQLFAVIFAYDAAGQPTWYVMSGGSWNAARDTYTGAIYSPRGRPLNEHTAANLVMGAPVGTMALTFSDVMSLRAAIAFGTNNINPTIKFLERQLFGPRETRQVGRMDDMWWAGVQRAGWGLAIHQQYASLFSVLFTYGTDGKPVWYPMPSGTWTSNNVWEGHVYKPSGPMWPAPYDPALFVITAVGSFKLDFGNGAAIFDFSAEGRTSHFPITRMGF